MKTINELQRAMKNSNYLSETDYQAAIAQLQAGVPYPLVYQRLVNWIEDAKAESYMDGRASLQDE